MKVLTCDDCGQEFTWPNRKKRRCRDCDAAAKRLRQARWFELRYGDRNSYEAEYRERNREKLRTYSREYAARRRVPKPRDPDLLRLKELQEIHPDRASYLRKRRHHLRDRYGIGLLDYEQILNSQNGCCAICGATEPEPFRMHVDHDHETGGVRGLLCGNCNPLLGLAREDTEILAAAIRYLEAQ